VAKALNSLFVAVDVIPEKKEQTKKKPKPKTAQGIAGNATKTLKSTFQLSGQW
jgi:hypothetical protein